MTTYERVRELVLELSDEERASLIVELTEISDFSTQEEIDKAWIDEAEEIIDAVSRGDMKTYSMEEVHNEIREQIEQASK